MTAEEILPKLQKVRRSQNGWTALCPVHEDQRASLSLTEKGSRVLLHCFKGCSFKDIVLALGMEPVSQVNGQKKIVAVYQYTDETGKLLYENVRFEPKDFRQRHYDSARKEKWNLEGVRRVPYGLPQLLSLEGNHAVLMAEGEKDADAIAGLNLRATNHKNWRPEFNYLLKARDVVIFQDHDEAGVNQARRVAEMIRSHAREIKIIDFYAQEPLPQKHGKDVSDYIADHTTDEFLEFIRDAPLYEPFTESIEGSNAFPVICLADVKPEEVSWLWKPFIALGEFTILEGIEGLGKSWLCYAIACAVASGGKLPFSQSEPIAPSNVLLLSAEDSLAHATLPRLTAMGANLNRIFALDQVFALNRANDLVRFEAVIATYNPKLVVIDPMFSFTGGKDLNQESESRPIASSLIKIAQKFNCAIVGVRHIGKSKGNGDARAAGLGSISWRAAARSGLLVGQDAETGERALCQTKNNLAPIPDFAVAFEIKDGGFFWKGAPSRLTHEKMLAPVKNEEARAEQSQAVDVLRECLREGERPSKEVWKEAREAGVTKYGFEKAKSVLRVKSFKKGGNFGGENCWYLRLEDAIEVPEDSDSIRNHDFQQTDSNKTSYQNELPEETEGIENRVLQESVT